MKKVIKASSQNSNQLPITELTEDELYALPQQVTLVTRQPGPSSYVPVFKVVNKEKIAADPDKCFVIDSYWGYAHGRDIYIASRRDIEEYKKSQIAAIENQFRNYARYAL